MTKPKQEGQFKNRLLIEYDILQALETHVKQQFGRSCIDSRRHHSFLQNIHRHDRSWFHEVYQTGKSHVSFSIPTPIKMKIPQITFSDSHIKVLKRYKTGKLWISSKVWCFKDQVQSGCNGNSIDCVLQLVLGLINVG